MPSLRNTVQGYGWIAIILHWLMAILIFTMLALGLYMTSLSLSMEKVKLYGWHKELGILILALASLRLLWRLANILPAWPPAMPYWQQLAARAVHLSFYGFIFALPITGWLLSSAAGLQVSFFGWFLLPNLIAAQETTRIFFTNVHIWLAYLLMAAIAAHIAAACWHQFFHKDEIFRRIWP